MYEFDIGPLNIGSNSTDLCNLYVKVASINLVRYQSSGPNSSVTDKEFGFDVDM